MAISTENQSATAVDPLTALRFRMAASLLGKMVKDATLEISCLDSSMHHVIAKGDKDRRLFEMELNTAATLWSMLRAPDPGLGEAFMDGKWTLRKGDLGEFLTMVARERDNMLSTFTGKLIRHLINKRPPQYSHDIAASYDNVQHHYDIGDDLYRGFLDEGMNYSCAFFASPEQSLRDAQLNKIDTTIKRLDVKPGMRVLDIGCGWGETTRRLASTRGAISTGVTLARNQLEHAKALASGIEPRPEYLLQDYREHAAQHENYYDRIVSIGMVEHVGRGHLDNYFEAVNQQLRPGGKALIHSIVRSGKPATAKLSSPWLIKYIFPGGHVPEVFELTQNAQEQGLELVGEPFIHASFNYAETLRRWRQNFLAHYEKLDHKKYDMRFKRMWLFYFCMCEAMFEGCDVRVAQIVLEKPVK
ncbi:MAG: cyclopropane-fatty-acyl-phospholipid synthase family protein [Pseudomonadales bacterium]|nr:cyclopropane-fatty-acyl-phospholipid synthase family protein [Pseudomonadales bacterium]